MNVLDFGKTKNKQSAHLYVLENDNISFSVSDYRATLVEFIHKKTGTDVVLGYDDVSGYERNMGYLGAPIGRVANRIRDGKFKFVELCAIEKDSGKSDSTGELVQKSYDKCKNNCKSHRTFCIITANKA